jgi:hypothetical protein
MNRIENARREARERKLLAATERARLLAEGAAQVDADKLARRSADDFFSAHRKAQKPKPDVFGKLVSFFVGAHVRAVLAAVLLAGCGVWAWQNGLLPFVQSQNLAALEQSAELVRSKATSPLHVDFVPASYTKWLDSFNVGVAGLMLLGSLCFRGNTMSVLAIVGAGVALAGHHLGIRTVEPVRDIHLALILGTILCFVGFRLGSR